MCRMMGIVGSRGVAQELAARFRKEAHEGRVARGMQPGHTDGWGIVIPTEAGLAHAGISTADAGIDPAYPRAVARIAEATPHGATLVHLRKATAGAKTLANTHPFIEGGYAFCHNGTIRAFAPAGESDSRLAFQRVLAEVHKGATVEEALMTLARDVDERYVYTSLTVLMTDGRALWGLRKVGNDPVACAPDACAPDYYTLGHARLADGSVVVSQEHELLGIEGWKPVADGDIVHVSPEGKVALRSTR